MSPILPKGAGEGKHRFRIHLSAQVRIDSEIIRADNSLDAYKIFRSELNLDTLLRNLAGTDVVAQVEYGDRLILAKIDLAGDDGHCRFEILRITEEGLKQLEKEV